MTIKSNVYAPQPLDFNPKLKLFPQEFNQEMNFYSQYI